MNEKVIQLHEVIQEAPDWAKPIAELVEWSLNYDHKTGTPYWAFLDIIGYSDEEYGEKLNAEQFCLDYASADSFADSLKLWAIRPDDVYDFITKVQNAD
jgi:hypothetical protein